jgi:predicted MFS family arabinose efflux permease
MFRKLPSFLHNRYGQAIIVSAFFSQLGIWIRNFSVLLFVMNQSHGDAFFVSLVSIAEYAPIFLFSLIGGALADRLVPRKTVIWCELLTAVSVLVILVALLLGTWKTIFFVTFVSSILSQIAQPAGMKLYKVHVPVEQMQVGISLLQNLFAIFTVLGPIIGTFIYQTFGIYIAIFITFVTFLLSAFALTFIPAGKIIEQRTVPSRLVEDMIEGIRYVFSRKMLALLCGCITVVGLGVGLIAPLGIFLVTEKLGLTEEKLQWTTIPYGVGEILGSAITIGVSRKFSPQLLLAIGLLANATGIWMAGHSTILLLTMMAQFLVGFTQPFIFTGNTTLTMQYAEESLIGRVMGVRTPLMTGAMVAMMALSGVWKTHFSLESIYSVSALLFMIGFVLVIPMFNLAKKAE